MRLLQYVDIDDELAELIWEYARVWGKRRIERHQWNIKRVAAYTGSTDLDHYQTWILKQDVEESYRPIIDSYQKGCRSLG